MRPETPKLCSIPAPESERALRLCPPAQKIGVVPSLRTAATDGPTGPLGALFAALVEADPGAIAVSDGAVIRRGALLGAADALARRLRSRGAGVGTPVAICLEPSVDAVIAALGVLRAGAVCLPIDPCLPLSRRVRMAAAVGAELQVCRQDAALPGVEVAPLRGVDPGGALPLVGPEDAAYLLFVPSATGSPKAVALPHRAIARLADPGAAGQTLGALAGASTAVAVAELWVALLSGARLEIASPNDAQEPVRLARWLAARSVGSVRLSPSMLRRLLRTQPSALAPLRRLIVHDSADPALLFAAASACSGEVTNGFYRTEAGILVAEQSVAASAEGVLDRALPGTRLEVLDAAGHPAAPGEPGELWVGGDAVALGYWGEPANPAFCPDPSGRRMFRTGERACWTRDGALLRLGRADDRVVVDGLPIEPAEIEATLLAHPSIRSAAVVAVGEGDEKQLYAYVTGRAAREDSVWMHLRDRLPGPLLPAEIIRMSALPMTSGRRVDRRALAAPVPLLRVVQ